MLCACVCVSDFSVSVQGVLGGQVHGATLALGSLSQDVLLGIVELEGYDVFLTRYNWVPRVSQFQNGRQQTKKS